MPAVWVDRVWREFRAGNLTRAHRDVLLTLRTFRGAGGRLHPAHATLGDRAGCSARTAQRALQQARHLGLVTWTERRGRAAWRWLRTSNAYTLEMPAGLVEPGLRAPLPRPATTGQRGGGGETSKKEALEVMLRSAAGLPDLLAMRRAAFSGSAERNEGWPACHPAR